MKMQLAALGSMALLAQVALLRELNVAFFGSELILILAVGVWLLAVGAGAVVRWPGTPPDPTVESISRWFIALALLLPLALAVIRVLRPLLGALPGAYPSLGGMLLAVPVILFPVAVPLGRLFRELAGVHVRMGGTLARAYALESAGSLLGGLLATGLLVVGAPNLAVLWLAAFIAAVAGWWTLRSGNLGRVAMVLALILLIGTPWMNHLDAQFTALGHPDLLAVRDTPYGRLTLLQRGDQKVVLVNDALVYEDQGTATEAFVHLAALQIGKLDSVLVVGGVARGVIGKLLQHDPASITGVELDRRGFELQHRLLSPADRAGLEDPRVTVVFDDPRTWLHHRGRFDLILIQMPQPDSGLSNRYYTREFFTLCAAHLRPGGVLAFSLRAAENYWTPLLTWRNASIMDALKESLPEVTVLPGVTSIVLASRVLLPGPEVLAGRFTRRSIQARLIGPAYIRYLYTNDRREEIAVKLDGVHPPLNTDLHPVCYQYSLALWLSRFHPELALAGWMDWTAGLSRTNLFMAGVLLLAVVLMGRRWLRSTRDYIPRLFIVFAAGWFGMLLESVLVLAYQTSSGVLYRDLGLLLTMFMAGLTVGAWLPEQLSRVSFDRRSIRILLVSPSLLATLTVFLLTRSGMGGLPMTSFLLLASGGVTGALFALAAASGPTGAVAVIGPLYAVDLLGGCLASIVGSLLLMPMLGLGATAMIAGCSVLVLVFML